ncbi:MAG: UDP-3-O-(3-hydroxymyristoyl)glucosamine N-acyltransferase [Candidatus Krumholzibacteria bacterium]|nr:UDP-3-O-(3-hydroxymyristoyl)glucosamine N-acyltransferase [Candidatus Krumholzibacteria bacterium]
MASYKLEELARLVGGEIIGDRDITIGGVAGIKEAREGEITFLANSKYDSYLATTRASAVIADRNGGSPKPIIKVSNPYLAFLKVMSLFSVDSSERRQRGIHATAIISTSAKIGADVSIGAYCYVGENAMLGSRTTVLPLVCICDEVKIGEDCFIYPHVTIREQCEIGNRVILHAGVVVGSDGFGYAKDGELNRKIPQIGIVRIEDDVEIGANAAIDRATTDATIIKRGVKIDNLVQIAHNVVVGEDSILAAQVGISGSTQLGRNVVLAGQAGLVGHIQIGDNAMVGAQGGVTKSVPANTKVSGYPAREHGLARKIYALIARLPDLFKEVGLLEKRVEELEKGTKVDSSAKDD